MNKIENLCACVVLIVPTSVSIILRDRTARTLNERRHYISPGFQSGQLCLKTYETFEIRRYNLHAEYRIRIVFGFEPLGVRCT